MRWEKIEELLTPKELGRFKNWMEGQTVSIYPDGATNYYDWDVKRFLDLVRKGIPTYFD